MLHRKASLFLLANLEVGQAKRQIQYHTQGTKLYPSPPQTHWLLCLKTVCTKKKNYCDLGTNPQ